MQIYIFLSYSYHLSLFPFYLFYPFNFFHRLTLLLGKPYKTVALFPLPEDVTQIQRKRIDQRRLSDLNNPLSLGHLQACLHDARLIADLSIFFTVYFAVV